MSKRLAGTPRGLAGNRANAPSENPKGIDSTGRREVRRKKEVRSKLPSRPFDPQRWSEVPELQACLDTLCSELTERENRQRKRSEAAGADFKSCIKAIVLDLYCAHVADPHLTVGIPKGRTMLQKMASSRYYPAFLSARAFEGAYDGLLDAGYMHRVKRGHFSSANGSGEVARMQASPKLLEHLRGCGISISWIIKRPSAEGIILKDNQKRQVSYGDLPYTSGARDRLSIINARLAQHWYDLELPDQAVRAVLTRERGKRAEEAAHPFDLTARQLYRVFNNSSWEEGGRFYGGWWQSIPKELRRFVTIDGKQTVEVDYSGLHAAILFAESGLVASDDPYARCFPDDIYGAMRPIVKKTFNALLNAKSIKALSSFNDYDPKRTGMTWSDFKDYIVSCFPEVREHIGTGVGTRLQRKDADLAEEVMLRFSEMQYPCLPVHDSFLVYHTLEDDLHKVMYTAFKRVFGQSINMKHKPSDINYEATGWNKTGIDEILEMNGHEERLREWKSSRDCSL
jgi:hypothetical protein